MVTRNHLVLKIKRIKRKQYVKGRTCKKNIGIKSIINDEALIFEYLFNKIGKKHICGKYEEFEF